MQQSGQNLIICVYSSPDCSIAYDANLWYNYIEWDPVSPNGGPGAEELVTVEIGNDQYLIQSYAVEVLQSDGQNCGCQDTDTFDVCF